MSTPSLLKWERKDYHFSAFGLDAKEHEVLSFLCAPPSVCPWCTSEIEKQEREYHYELTDYFQQKGVMDYPPTTVLLRLAACSVCGWYADYEGWYTHVAKVNFKYGGTTAILRQFPIDDDQNVSIRELATYLKTHFSDVTAVPPRRFEELVGDIFQGVGYHIRLTKKSHDGGVDLYLLSKSEMVEGIVQVKRYAATGTVGVALVRELYGVQCLSNVPRSFLVTSSYFSREAEIFADTVNKTTHSHAMTLWDGLDVVHHLGCYNEEIVPFGTIRKDRPLAEQIPKHGCGLPRTLNDVACFLDSGGVSSTRQ